MFLGPVYMCYQPGVVIWSMRQEPLMRPAATCKSSVFLGLGVFAISLK